MRAHLFAHLLGAAAPVFDPATRNFTAWHRGSFTSPTWSPTASAGTSGTNGNFAYAPAPPATGTALNGLTPANFDGVDDMLLNATTMSNRVSNAAGSGFAFIKAASAVADTGSTLYYSHPAILSDDANGFWSLSLTASGARLGCYNGTNFDGVTAACSVAADHIIMFRWNATTIEIRVDSNPWVTLARTVSLAGADGMRLGANYNATAMFAGDLREWGLEQVRWTDTEANNIKANLNTRFGTAL